MDRFTLRDHDQEQRVFRSRLSLVSALVVVALFASLASVFYLQLVKGQHYKTLSHENHIKIVPLEPTRGLIYSSDGVVVAENRPSFSLELTPELVEDIDATLAGLADLVDLSPRDEQRFREQLERKRRFEKIPIRFNLSEHEVARFAVNKYRFPGVSIEARLSRHYPYPELMVHVTGYVGQIDEDELQRIDASNYSGTTHIGKTGVEKSYESELHGRVGFQQVEVDAHGRVIRIVERTPPTPGRDVYLTVNMELQRVAAEALGDSRGAIVAMDPNNGAMLALVSSPGFDANDFVNGIEVKDYAALANTPDRPLFNRALQGHYPPGSTLKPFLGLAALQADSKVSKHGTWCPGWYMLAGDDRRYRDWKRTGHGRMNLKLAIGESCDVFFYELAHELGIDRIYSFLVQFGFGGSTGIDLPNERSGLLPSREWKRKSMNLPWFPGETLITGIGQGFMLVTPVQLAVATAILSKRGYASRPRIVERIEDPIGGESVDFSLGESYPAVALDESSWDLVHESMEYVVHGATGTARRTGEGASYRFAGKTGTSQLFGLPQDEDVEDALQVDDRLQDHALFIAFAPAENPLIVCAIVVENGGSGSRAAAPIARAIFDQYLEASFVGTN